MAQLVGAPARRAGDPGLNPGPDENFSLELIIIIVIIDLSFLIFVSGELDSCTSLEHSMCLVCRLLS